MSCYHMLCVAQTALAFICIHTSRSCTFAPVDSDGNGKCKPSRSKKAQGRTRDSGDDTDDDEGRSSGKAKAKSGSGGKANKKPPITGFTLWRKVAYKKLFGWLDPKFKLNGKKLVADSTVVWRFMVSARRSCTAPLAPDKPAQGLLLRSACFDASLQISSL